MPIRLWRAKQIICRGISWKSSVNWQPHILTCQWPESYIKCISHALSKCNSEITTPRHCSRYQIREQQVIIRCAILTAKYSRREKQKCLTILDLQRLRRPMYKWAKQEVCNSYIPASIWKSTLSKKANAIWKKDRKMIFEADNKAKISLRACSVWYSELPVLHRVVWNGLKHLTIFWPHKVHEEPILTKMCYCKRLVICYMESVDSEFNGSLHCIFVEENLVSNTNQ